MAEADIPIPPEAEAEQGIDAAGVEDDDVDGYTHRDHTLTHLPTQTIPNSRVKSTPLERKIVDDYTTHTPRDHSLTCQLKLPPTLELSRLEY